jgi:DNA repair exonuclease SbcCD ATPase subunit
MIENNSNLINTLRTEMAANDDEAFKLKVKALIKSRETLKQQNEELSARLRALEQRESGGTYSQGKSELERVRAENERLRYDMERRLADRERTSTESQRLHSSLEELRSENERLLGMATTSGRQPSNWYASDSVSAPPTRERSFYDERSSFRDRQPTLETNAQMGDMFSKAQSFADKIVADAEKEVRALKYEAATIQQSLKDDIDRAARDVRKMRTFIGDVTNSLNTQIEGIERMLEECRRKFV